MKIRAIAPFAAAAIAAAVYFAGGAVVSAEQATKEEAVAMVQKAVAAIEAGFPQKEIADASYRYQQDVDAGNKTVVGVNRYVSQEDERPEILKIGEDVEREQLERLGELRRTRDEAALQAALGALREGATRKDNLIPLMLAAVRAYGTVGEISQALVPVCPIASVAVSWISTVIPAQAWGVKS